MEGLFQLGAVPQLLQLLQTVKGQLLLGPLHRVHTVHTALKGLDQVPPVPVVPLVRQTRASVVPLVFHHQKQPGENDCQDILPLFQNCRINGGHNHKTGVLNTIETPAFKLIKGTSLIQRPGKGQHRAGLSLSSVAAECDEIIWISIKIRIPIRSRISSARLRRMKNFSQRLRSLEKGVVKQVLPFLNSDELYSVFRSRCNLYTHISLSLKNQDGYCPFRK